MVIDHQQPCINVHYRSNISLTSKAVGGVGKINSMEETRNIKQLRREVLAHFQNELDSVKAVLEPMGYSIDDFKITAAARKAMRDVPNGSLAYVSTASLLIMYNRARKEDEEAEIADSGTVAASGTVA